MHDLAVEVDVKATDLGLVIDPETHHRADDLEQDEAHHPAIGDGDGDALQLDEDLAGVALEDARRAADGLDGETPVSSAPTMPPTACTPKTSRESS